ncbi:MAG: HAD domain-containing protein [Elusimicrobia bacterium]|nr:HAD domain-containing protein [Elusimicrobiota bacterium]
MRRILFLDFDGVLNNTAFFAREAERRKALPLDAPYSPRHDFDPANLTQLAVLAAQIPDLEVVVSSSWRKGRPLADLRDYLSPAFTRNRVIGVTPGLPSRLRHEEIRAWLKTNGAEDARFLALDDDTYDMHQLGKNFLHVDRETGLTAAHVEQALIFFAQDLS